MSEEKKFLTEDELDAIGEVMNMSMGSAATAVSTMLDRQVIISTPMIDQEDFSLIDYSELDPAIVVRIKYVKGIEGENVIVFKRKDMQIILGLLMGGEINTGDDFEFDDFSMSAACEVMNQMMGASATALSKVLETTIDISTPTAYLADGSNIAESAFKDRSFDEDENVVSISFKLEIKDLLDTTFCSVMTPELARRIVDSVYKLNTVMPDSVESAAPAPAETPAPAPAAAPAPAQQAPPVQQQPAPSAQQAPPVQQQQAPPVQQQPAPPIQQAPPVQQVPPMQQAPPVQQQQPMPQYYPQQGYAQPPMGYPAQGYGQPPMGYPPYPQQQPMYTQPPVNMHSAEFPEFRAAGSESPLTDGNMGLLMNVKLDVSVVIGNTKRKIKDILDFGQGTVVELDKQTGAPADIVVNGQLIAKGDVMVVGDNFGVRITELTGTKELMDSLGSNV